MTKLSNVLVPHYGDLRLPSSRVADKAQTGITETKIFELDSESLPMINRASLALEKTSPEAKNLVAQVIASPAKPITSHKEVESKHGPSFLEQIKGGLIVARNILMPLWLGAWLLGWGFDKAVRIAGFETPPPAMLPISRTLNDKLLVSSTPSDPMQIVEIKNIHGKKRHVVLFVDQSESELWKHSKQFRENLSLRSPELSTWFEGMYARGKISFLRETSSERGAIDGRYSDYRKYEGRLTIYSSFWDLSDAEKITVLAHEYSHARENWGEYLSNSLVPQVVVGSFVRVGAAHLGDRASSLTNPSSWPTQWSYWGNRSELRALNEEIRFSQGIHDSTNPSAISELESFNKFHNIPGQEFGGLLLSFLYARGFVSFLKKRRATSTAPLDTNTQDNPQPIRVRRHRHRFA